jgi:hypothetical protein
MQENECNLRLNNTYYVQISIVFGSDRVKMMNSKYHPQKYKIHIYLLNDYKVEEDEVGGTCGTNGGEEERV